jgi:hypothetical protein
VSYPQPVPWPPNRPPPLPPPSTDSTDSSATPPPTPTTKKYTVHQRWCYGATPTHRTSPDPAPVVSQEVITSSGTSATTHPSITQSQHTAPAFPSSAPLWRRQSVPAPLPPHASPPTSGKFWPTWATLNSRPQSSATTRSLSVSRPIASTSRCQSQSICVGIGSGIASDKVTSALCSFQASAIMLIFSQRLCPSHVTSSLHPSLPSIQMSDDVTTLHYPKLNIVSCLYDAL